MNKKILFIIVGCLRPRAIKSLQSWEPIIKSFKNVEILYVLQNQINLIPESISDKKWKDAIFYDHAAKTRHVLHRLFGPNLEEIKIIENFCKQSNILPLNVPLSHQYSSPMDYSFLYETLPFINELKCHILLLNNNSYSGNANKMYASWKEAREYIIYNNINFDYCIKIRPDYITSLSPDKFSDILSYCISTNNIVVDTIWSSKEGSGPRVGDQVAIGSYKNIIIYLNAAIERENIIKNRKTGSTDSHIMLRDYLRDHNITMANGLPFLKGNIMPWQLQRNRYFKEFLYKNSANEYYSEFLTLLNQFNTSS